MMTIRGHGMRKLALILTLALAGAFALVSLAQAGSGDPLKGLNVSKAEKKQCQQVNMICGNNFQNCTGAIQGDKLYLVVRGGRTILPLDGSYTTTDGTKIVIKNGRIDKRLLPSPIKKRVPQPSIKPKAKPMGKTVAVDFTKPGGCK